MSAATDALAAIELPSPYVLRWLPNGFRVAAYLPDTYTGAKTWQSGPWHSVRPNQTPSDVVRAVFGAYLAFIEHEAREGFKYRGARVFGPHIDVDALVEVADRLDHEVPA